MRIVITGSLGYVAPAVIAELRATHPDSELIGVDTGWFTGALRGSGRAPETLLDQQWFVDVRDLTATHFVGVDFVVHLAAVSNDPMGNEFTDVTTDINQTQSIRIAELARGAGARGFVLASSASVYGAGSDIPRNEDSELAPQTAYARSKIGAEQQISKLAEPDFQVSCLRFSTACGWSPRVRLDLVLNDFVASALLAKKIVVLSDGTPWRPLIHIKDMARAVAWTLSSDRARAADSCVVNVGADDWNFNIAQLATTVSEQLAPVDVDINRQAPADKRSYRLDFTRWRELAPNHQPTQTIAETIGELADRLGGVADLGDAFRSSPLMRLHALKSLRAAGQLDDELRWVK